MSIHLWLVFTLIACWLAISKEMSLKSIILLFLNQILEYPFLKTSHQSSLKVYELEEHISLKKVEERGDIRKFHWMTEGRWYEITYEQFARLFGFRREDANRNKIHFALHLDASKLRFMYPSNKRGGVETTSDLLPFYAYLNRLFKRVMTHREGDNSNILSYNRNLLLAMAPRPHIFDLCVFDFIWEEIKAISKSHVKSYGYAPYIMHMIERVTARTFGCDKEHHPLRIKNDLWAPVEDRRAAAP
jgi:hypothetical protein